MGIFGKIKLAWRSMRTQEKIELVLDILSNAGCAIGGVIVGNKLSEGRNPLEKICIRTATAGLGLAAGDISSKALKDNYAPLAATLIDRTKTKVAEAKKKSAEEKMKEAISHE